MQLTASSRASDVTEILPSCRHLLSRVQLTNLHAPPLPQESQGPQAPLELGQASEPFPQPVAEPSLQPLIQPVPESSHRPLPKPVSESVSELEPVQQSPEL